MSESDKSFKQVWTSITVCVRYADRESYIKNNPILEKREIAVEHLTNYLKIGDGIRHWCDLPYENLTQKDAGETIEKIAIEMSDIRKNNQIMTEKISCISDTLHNSIVLNIITFGALVAAIIYIIQFAINYV